MYTRSRWKFPYPPPMTVADILLPCGHSFPTEEGQVSVLVRSSFISHNISSSDQALSAELPNSLRGHFVQLPSSWNSAHLSSRARALWSGGMEMWGCGEISFGCFITTRERSLKDDPNLHKKISLEDRSPKTLKHISVAMSWARGIWWLLLPHHLMRSQGIPGRHLTEDDNSKRSKGCSSLTSHPRGQEIWLLPAA